MRDASTARPARARGRIYQAALLATLLACVPARAEIRSLAFPVRNMVCPLCTRGVEEAIKRLPGVARVSADLATGRVVVEAQERMSLDIQQVRERAARAGFPPDGEADVVARGRFNIAPSGRITFRPSGGSSVWQVVETTVLMGLFRDDPHLKGEYVIGFRLHDRPPWTRPVIALTRGGRAPRPDGGPAAR